MKIFLASLLLLFFSQRVYAQEYVLPYPSEMPGSNFYLIHQVREVIDEVLIFGNLANFTYYRNLSDKYLVEAKTLFEYNQFLLGKDSLTKSNVNYLKEIQNLREAENQRKDIKEKKIILENQKAKHIKILSKLKKEVPENFEWVPENKASTNIKLWELIDQAILLRK